MYKDEYLHNLHKRFEQGLQALQTAGPHLSFFSCLVFSVVFSFSGRYTKS